MHTAEYCIVPTDLVQLEQFANSFQDKPNCSTDTLVEVLSIFGKSRSQKMLLQDFLKLARLFLVILQEMSPVKSYSRR